jgi:hypothetical protein
VSGTYDFCVDQGADFSAVLTWTANGEAVNLTGWSAHMQVRNGWADGPGSTVFLDLSSSGSGLTLGGAAGTIQITITNAETSALTAGHYIYDLKMTSGSGLVTRLLAGSFMVTSEVTV